MPLALKRLFCPPRSESPTRYRLLRNFSIVSLSSFILATGLLAVFYRQRAIHDLVVVTEANTVSLTQVFSNTLWKDYKTFLSSNQELSDEELARDPRIRQLQRDVLAKLDGLSVVKVKIFDLQGRTIFSSDLSQIGADKSKASGFIAAKSGEVVSQLGHRDIFQALHGTLEDRHLLSSYIPIRTGGFKGEIVGVFELYTDVTPLLRQIDRTQRTIVLGSLLILTVLYSILFLFVRRANRLLKKQYRQLQDSESRYRQQAGQLERVLNELQKTQAQILQSEKMSSLGQVVAGVAHEINNPISFISGNISHVEDYAKNLLNLVQLYQQYYPDPAAEIRAEIEEIDLEFIQDDLPKILSSMHVGSDRIREIVLSLRNFSRLNEADIKLVNIHEGIDSTLMLLQHRLKGPSERSQIRVIRDYATFPLVECYPGLLNQVFMNILNNAIDAVEEKAKRQTPDNPGQIVLRTTVIDDGWVQIAIADNGPGIPPDILPRIFDPFFTTKPVGKGTGMGLAIAYQIITEKNGGKLECFSIPNRGTEFVIEIPVRHSH